MTNDKRTGPDGQHINIDLTPSMPDFPDGLIPGDKLDQPVRVEAPRWTSIVSGDEYILVLTPSGLPERDVQTIPITRDTPFPLAMSLAVDELRTLPNGTHSVRFDIHLNRAGDRYPSNELPFTVDRRLPAPIIDEANEGKLHLPSLIGDNVRIRVEDHHATAGTRIRLTWAGPASPWTSEETVASDNQPLEFLMPVAEADLRTGDVVISYVRLEDGAASHPLDLIVTGWADVPGAGKPLKPAKWLAPTRRPDADIPEIRQEDVLEDGGTYLRIYRYANMAAGDRVDMLFEGHDGQNPSNPVLPGTQHEQTYIVTEADLVEKDDDSEQPPVKAVYIDVHVPIEHFYPFEHFGSATFLYEVTNDAGTGFSERDDIRKYYIYVSIREPWRLRQP